MHTVSTYPCPEELLNLKMINFLKKNLSVMWDIVAMRAP